MHPADYSGYSIKIAARREFEPPELLAMYQFRASVFRQRLSWEVGLLGEMEVDAYDALDPVYLMMRDEVGAVCACLRMLPTTGPYMLQNTFSELMQDCKAPVAENMLELSRFAVASRFAKGFGFSEMTCRVIRAAIDYGSRHGLENYVTVTTPALERLLLRFGLTMQRLGRPARMGVEEALALVIDIPASYQNLRERYPD